MTPSVNNNKKYKKQHNVTTSLIRNAKGDCCFKKMGPNPLSRTICKNLKNQLSNNQKQPEVPDIEKLNEYFVTIGSVLSTKNPIDDEPVKVPNNVKSMVLS